MLTVIDLQELRSSACRPVFVPVFRMVTALVLFPVYSAVAREAPLIKSVSVIGTKIPVPLDTQAGRPYNSQVIDKDVRRLWKTGRFSDIRVESTEEPEGQSVVFRVIEHPIHVKQLNFIGHPGLSENELRGALRALRFRRIFGYRLLPSYSAAAIDSDLARLHSLYTSKGYFDAEVRLYRSEIDGQDARVKIFVNSGPRYHVRQWPVAGDGMPAVIAQSKGELFDARDLCSCLFAARRQAQREGILDFSARMEIHRIASLADVMIKIERGPSYRLGRIDFRGNHNFSDAAVRGNFVLKESDLFDQRLLRKSIQRLNESMMFAPISMRDVVIRPDERTGMADVAIRLAERGRAAWLISGPVGPASLAGPLQASILSRLPAWGRGIVELSTYSLSFSMVAFANPVIPVLGLTAKHMMFPFLAVQRPFTPSEGWLSGFTISPQLNWRLMAAGYVTTQVQRRLIAALEGDTAPELTVAVEGLRMDGPLFCGAPKLRARTVRKAGMMALQFLGR